LLDEPYTNLDAAGSELMSAMLVDHVGRGGQAVVVAHHDLAVAAATRRLELPG
jgi:ABC-type transport system involved in cytochrome c biogenesis ATPase subunit